MRPILMTMQDIAEFFKASDSNVIEAVENLEPRGWYKPSSKLPTEALYSSKEVKRELDKLK